MKKYSDKKINSDFILYLDMDGVLCDFVSSFIKDFSHWYPELNKNKEILKTLDKKECAKLINSIDGWYSKLPWMEEGKQLFNFCKTHFFTIKILTTPFDSVKTCRNDKLFWVKKHLGNYEVIFTPHKEDYASKNSILIDDMEYNILPFIDKGGTGILYKNFQKTKEILLNFLDN
jgi:hypothetical protein